MKAKFTLFVIFFMSIIIFSSCKSAWNVKKVENPKDEIQGIKRYALPKNKVIVNVLVEKKHFKPNQFSRTTNQDKEIIDILDNLYYTTGFDDDFRKIKKDSSYYKFKSITLVDSAYVDTKNIYELKLKKRWNKKVNSTINTTELGLIKNIKLEEEDLTVELVTQAVSSVVSIVGSFLSESKAIEKKSKAIGFKTLDEIEKSAIKDKKIKVLKAIHLARNYKKISNEFKKMTETSIELKTFRSYEHFEKSLKYLKKKRDDLKKEFTYIQKVKSYNLYFEIDFPENLPTTISKENLIQINKNKGVEILNTTAFSLKSDTSGLRIKTIKIGDKKDIISYTYSPYKNQIITDKTKFKETAEKGNGFRYRIPLQIKFDVFKNNALLATKNSMISQLGTIVVLPKKLNSVELEYIESLGLVKSISTQVNSSLSKDNISNIGSTIKSGVDLRKTELEKLKEKAELLELRKKIKDLENGAEN